MILFWMAAILYGAGFVLCFSIWRLEKKEARYWANSAAEWRELTRTLILKISDIHECRHRTRPRPKKRLKKAGKR